MIRYKVVKYHDRTSAFATGDYEITYYKGKIISKPEGSLGIFVFKTLKEAVDFDDFYCCFDSRILKVRTFGRGKTPKKIAGGMLRDTINWFYNDPNVKFQRKIPPRGTVCYDKIEVLE